MQSRAQGLPGTPRSRSRTRARAQENDIHPQKTLSSHRTNQPSSSSSSAIPPLPRPSARPHRAPSESSSYRSSDDSLVSSTSSFLDRFRAGTGYTSSRTSIDEDDPPPVKAPNSSATSYTIATNGSTVWNTVAGAASSLTVNVSKAWATNMTVLAGEETPPGTESRLTRAMKAYHREKAQSPADLPSWLFDESERRVAPLISTSDPPHDDPKQHTRPSRGLRDVYQSVSESSASPSHSSGSSRRTPAEPSQPSKATDRLKAMRDAKRAAVQGASSYQDNRPPSFDNGHDNPTKHLPPATAPRVGLPSGPGRRRY